MNRKLELNMSKEKIENWEKIAKLFHDTYEELAPFYGYITRKETRKFDPKSNNGRLMIEVCKKVFAQEKEKWQKEIKEKANKIIEKLEKLEQKLKKK